MLAIIVLAVIAAIGALAVLSFALHVLFSFLPLALVAIAILAWVRFRPRHSHR
jgi:hypothetical protein